MHYPCKMITLLLFLFHSPLLFAVDIIMAELQIFRDDADVTLTEEDMAFTEEVAGAFEEMDTASAVSLSRIPESFSADRVPKSFLDAAEVTELLQIDYLFYGSLEKTGRYYDAMVRLYDAERAEDRKVLYAKASHEDYDYLVQTMAEHMHDYLYRTLGLSAERLADNRGFGGIGLVGALGYWSPVGEWSEVISGIVDVEAGVNVVPLTPIKRGELLDFFVRYGATLGYSFGVNRPEVEEAWLHSFGMRIPVEFAFVAEEHHLISVPIGVQYRLDLLAQQPLYDDARTATSSGIGGFIGLNYEYWFGGAERDFAIGVSNLFDVMLGASGQMRYRAQIYSVFRQPFDGAERSPVEPVGELQEEEL